MHRYLERYQGALERYLQGEDVFEVALNSKGAGYLRSFKATNNALSRRALDAL